MRKAEVEWEEVRMKKVHPEEGDGEEQEVKEDNDDDFLVSTKKCLKKVNMMSHISGTADTLNLSVRKRTMLAASTSRAL